MKMTLQNDSMIVISVGSPLRPRIWAARQGMSLLEVLIAVSILVAGVLYMVLAFRGGASKQESFSSEHFTAMFLAQKMLEDINDQVVVNP